MNPLQRYRSVTHAISNTALRGIPDWTWMKITLAVEFGLVTTSDDAQEFTEFLHLRRHEYQAETITVLACSRITALCPLKLRK